MVAEAQPARSIGYRVFHVLMILVVIAAAVTVVAAIGTGVWERVKPDERLTSVRLVSDGSKVAGASASLTRSDEGIDFTLRSSGLATGHVMTLRGEIFNKPSKCKSGSGTMRCGPDDLSDPDVGGSVVFLAANFLRGTDQVALNGRLMTGDASKAITGGGLTEPRTAEIQLILMDHGPALRDVFGQMLTTIGTGCKNPPPGSGPAGPNDCIDLQYAVYK